ncbi:hypothetical protein [Streptomyces sp. URMC 124]|uniref:hypothetical protein n=1 Tax=Streptomyces sp. URMC 124 TaxID=3423405 RepID=UPI003F19756B
MFDLKAEADMRLFSDRLAADLARLKRGGESGGPSAEDPGDEAPPPGEPAAAG